jgi:hypothetical protein
LREEYKKLIHIESSILESENIEKKKVDIIGDK